MNPFRLLKFKLFTSELKQLFIIGVVILSSLNAFANSVFGPHQPPLMGPWFEGWYARVTDNKEHRSFAVIVASQLNPKERFIPGRGSSGYLAILTQDQENQPTNSFEAFPESTFILSQGRDLGTNSLADNSEFQWEAPGYGYLNNKGFDLKIPGKIEVKADLQDRKPWSDYWSNWGPEGYGSFMTFVPLHWFVQSLDSFANYTLRTFQSNGAISEIKSEGSAHFEKNWGKAFPKAWMWLQAHDEESNSSIALAGGILSLGPINVKTYLAGYKSNIIDAEFQIGQMFDMTFTDKIDPCNGQFQITIKNGEHVMKLKAKADPKSFASVSIPTKEGYQPAGGIESFSAEIEVEIHNNNWIRDFVSKETLLEKRIFKKAALEFGAEYMKCEKNK